MAYDKERVARRIKSLRIDKGYTQIQLAEASGVAYGTLQTYETASQVMTMEKAVKIADALGCSLDTLVCRED